MIVLNGKVARAQPSTRYFNLLNKFEKRSRIQKNGKNIYVKHTYLKSERTFDKVSRIRTARKAGMCFGDKSTFGGKGEGAEKDGNT